MRGNVGLGDFTDDAVKDPRVRRARGAKVRYRIDPAIPIRTSSPATSGRRCADGSVIEERQPHLRGGAQEPLTRADIEDKFAAQLRGMAVGDRTVPQPRSEAGEIALRRPSSI